MAPNDISMELRLAERRERELWSRCKTALPREPNRANERGNEPWAEWREAAERVKALAILRLMIANPDQAGKSGR